MNFKIAPAYYSGHHMQDDSYIQLNQDKKIQSNRMNMGTFYPDLLHLLATLEQGSCEGLLMGLVRPASKYKANRKASSNMCKDLSSIMKPQCRIKSRMLNTEFCPSTHVSLYKTKKKKKISNHQYDCLLGFESR